MHPPDQLMSFGTADLIVVIGYFAVMVWIGAYFSGRNVNIREYFGGGGKVPWWLSSVSYYMTTFSAFSFVIYPEIAYRDGLVGMSLFYMAVPAVFLTGYFFASLWHGAARTSALEFVEQRFGVTMRQGLAWMNIPLRVIDSGLKLLAIGTLLAGTMGLGQQWVFYAILFSGTVIFIYTFMGGLWGVMITDFVQAIVMFFAIAVLIPLSLIKAGGFMPIIDQAPPGYFNLTNETINVPYLLAWAAILFLNYSSAWSLVQRFYSVGSAREARKVAYGVGGLLLITPFLIMIPAFAARVILPDLQGAEIRQVYALVCRDLLPVGMVGLMIAAMFAATMSMLAGDYNAVAGVVTNDVYRGCLRKKATPGELLWVGRFATLAIGILALGIAMLLLRRPEDEALFEIMIKAFAFLLPPLAIPILAGLVSRQVSNLGAIVGLVAGAVTALGIFIATQVDEQYAILATNDLLVPSTAGATIAGLIIGTLISPATGEARERIDAFFNSFHQKHLEDTHLSQSARMSPLQVSGVCVIFLGIIMLLAVLPSIMEEGTWISVLVALAMAALGSAFYFSRPASRMPPITEAPPHE